MLLSTYKSAIFAVLVLNISQSAGAQTTSPVSEVLLEGRALYDENCAICHGPNGDGGGSLAPQFSPRPRDFTNGSFRFRSTDTGEAPAVTDLLKTITRGIEGSYGRSMPSFERLSFDQKVALLKVIQDFADIESFGVTFFVPPRPDTASAEKGAALYVEQGCVECHGAAGDGRGILADGLRDDENLPIRPTNFQVGMFKGGNSPEDIWMRLQTGLDGTPMPSFGRNLTLEESWSLVDYVLEFSETE